MKYLKLFEAFTGAEASAAAVLKYSSPVETSIKKDTTSGKQNVMAITSNGVTRKYRIVGSALFKNYDLNFKYIEKKPNGDMVFARYVDDGVDLETIPFDKVKAVLSQAAKGVSDINPVTGLHFYKI